MIKQSHPFERVEHAIDVARRGGMVIMVDDEDRENEGDLVIAAQHCDANAVNFMTKHGRGLICLSLMTERIEQLGLRMMVPTDPGSMGTAFTVSIEARRGVTTGISAGDRAETIRVASDPKFGAEDIVSPGHIFPLRAQPGGVLVRSGHTEGSVDLARLAGCSAAGVICEIMRDDGEMARMDDLEAFGREHGLPIVCIADMIEYRLQRESLIEEIAAAPFESAVLGITERDGWTMRSYRSLVSPVSRFVTLSKGEIDDSAPVLIRAQRAQLIGDVFGFGDDSATRMRSALARIDEAGRGVFLYVLGGPGHEVTEQLDLQGMRSRAPASPGLRPRESGFREFGLGAQVLKHMGVKAIRVLTDNPRKIVGLEGFGIEVIGSVPLG
ncbi:3,4-dihydroxy-2-butanone-4-phosphate synthase [Enhygromyxa salina]|uniref:3,4-dihydroxy-2-butanone 4-phosphate synthase n=1 Tax=Enhygromyxa salina TaxID=215803 RepID=A0A2S9YPN6_9BACT|nr:3,4-dihydroxy-2-butanone-4-phosphate synthase [Enhygromyxa salina]PRQ07053.1 Riboflavin biosynthesis protein RibBA [Enhygromyxa salina]